MMVDISSHFCIEFLSKNVVFIAERFGERPEDKNCNIKIIKPLNTWIPIVQIISSLGSRCPDICASLKIIFRHFSCCCYGTKRMM